MTKILINILSNHLIKVGILNIMLVYSIGMLPL
jgi:hypothetical protein